MYLTVAHLRAEKRGSLEDQLIALASRMSGRSDFWFSAWPIPTVRQAFRERGADVATVDFSRPLSAAARLARAVRQQRYRVVHFHFVRAHDPLVLAARAAGARVVLTDHMVLGAQPKPVPLGITHEGWLSAPAAAALGAIQSRPDLRLLRGMRALARNRLGAAADRRIAVSSAVAESLMRVEGVAPSRIHVVRNGIDVERFRPSAEWRAQTRLELGIGEVPTVLCVARFAREKGVDVLVRALAGSHKLGDVRLLLAGEGPERADLEQLARELGIAGRVRFLGVRSDLERLYPAADVVVVPSRGAESCSLVTLEGQACGVPVVASNVGGIPEHLSHGLGGMLVPPDDPEALGATLEALFAQPSLRWDLAAAGRRWAQAFSLERWSQQVLGAALEKLTPHLM